jgi:hypothetical protein
MDDILDAFQAALTIKDDTQQEQALKTVYNTLKNKVKSKAGDLYQKARVGFAKSQGIDPGELNEDSQAKIPYLPLSKKEVETLNSEGKITKTFAGTGFSHKVDPKTVNTYLNATEVTYTDWNTGQRVKAPVDVEYLKQVGSISITVYSALKNKVKTEASNLYQKARVGFAKSQDIDSSKLNEVEEETDAVDTITMDVPLFIRMLEYAREDASADVDLHDVAENAVSLNKEQDILSMDDYDALLPSDAEPLDEVDQNPFELPSSIVTKANTKVNDVKSFANILKIIYDQIQQGETIDFSKNQNIKYVLQYLDKAMNEKPVAKG